MKKWGQSKHGCLSVAIKLLLLCRPSHKLSISWQSIGLDKNLFTVFQSCLLSRGGWIFLARESNCIVNSFQVSRDQGLHISGLLWTYLHPCLSSCRGGTVPWTVFAVHLCCLAGQLFIMLNLSLFTFFLFSWTFGLQSCHTLSCSVESFRFVSCRVVSRRIVSCRVMLCFVVSCRTVSFRTFTFPTIPYRTVLCRVVPGRAEPSLVVPRRFLSWRNCVELCRALSCRVEPCRAVLFRIMMQLCRVVSCYACRVVASYNYLKRMAHNRRQQWTSGPLS